MLPFYEIFPATGFVSVAGRFLVHFFQGFDCVIMEACPALSILSSSPHSVGRRPVQHCPLFSFIPFAFEYFLSPYQLRSDDFFVTTRAFAIFYVLSYIR